MFFTKRDEINFFETGGNIWLSSFFIKSYVLANMVSNPLSFQAYIKIIWIRKSRPFRSKRINRKCDCYKINFCFPWNKTFVTSIVWLLILIQIKGLIFLSQPTKQTVKPNDNKSSIIQFFTSLIVQTFKVLVKFL